MFVNTKRLEPVVLFCFVFVFEGFMAPWGHGGEVRWTVRVVIELTGGGQLSHTLERRDLEVPSADLYV